MVKSETVKFNTSKIIFLIFRLHCNLLILWKHGLLNLKNYNFYPWMTTGIFEIEEDTKKLSDRGDSGT